MIWTLVGHGQLWSALQERFASCDVPFEHLSAQSWLKGVGLPSHKSKGIVLAIPDRYIPNAVRALVQYNLQIPVFHCSGATPLDVLAPLPHAGVWYPLHSFKNAEVAWDTRTIFWENPALASTFEDLHKDLQLRSGSWLDSATRGKYHLAAVWANNFSNHLVALYQEYLKYEGLEAMDEMLLETVKAGLAAEAKSLQTGPARRLDSATLAQHMEMLPAQLQPIYQALSESIARLDAQQDEL